MAFESAAITISYMLGLELESSRNGENIGSRSFPDMMMRRRNRNVA